MKVLEKIAIDEKIDERGIPSGSEFWPLAGLYFAARHKYESRINILDSSTVRPIYFFGAWVIHVSSLIVALSYIAHSLKL